MLNVATTRATPANTSRKFSKKPRKSSWMPSSISALSSAPVRLSMPSGSTASMRLTSSAWLTPGSAVATMLEARPGSFMSTCSAKSSVNAA